MRNQLITMAACLSVFSFTACQQSQNGQSGQQDTTQQVQDTTAAVSETPAADTTNAAALSTVMTVPEKVKAGAPIMVKFTVTNSSDREVEFCKWHTPFEEKFLNSFFDIQDAKGEPAQYIGPMAKRVSPPPADAYTKVPAKGNVSAEIDLLKGYKLSAPGTYKISFQGAGISGLSNVNEATFTIE
ncbi:hypothetical protein [Chitinophaga rhizophila]|uniref:Protease n=1 Tax=Chitinophaga rhizophila TaxID=2866212 RepID=A0ABS7GKF8_9BACT|nr:hypothetical protein [Chitinophaga rhizophila]MBW8688212.1 hypothetical protein [Chitinophaga rhizophila]